MNMTKKKSYLNQVLSVLINVAMLLWNIFWISVLEMILFSQFPHNSIIWKKNISSSFFEYSDRTVACTETNDTSTESSDTKLFADVKSKGVALSGGLHTHLLEKDIEKSKFNGAKSGVQDAKFFFFLIAPILFLYYELSECHWFWIITRFILRPH